MKHEIVALIWIRRFSLRGKAEEVRDRMIYEDILERFSSLTEEEKKQLTSEIFRMYVREKPSP